MRVADSQRNELEPKKFAHTHQSFTNLINTGIARLAVYLHIVTFNRESPWSSLTSNHRNKLPMAKTGHPRLSQDWWILPIRPMLPRPAYLKSLHSTLGGEWRSRSWALTKTSLKWGVILQANGSNNFISITEHSRSSRPSCKFVAEIVKKELVMSW